MRRQMSTKSTPSFTLPPEKLRALVSLYHQSGQFVTPETLDSAIDHAFIEDGDSHLFATLQMRYADMKAQTKDRGKLPKFGPPEELGYDGRLQVALQDERERRVAGVQDALYGTVGRVRPGLELLEDTWDEVAQSLKNPDDKGEP
ncbi:hypothetical protein FA95DRAFT_1488803 [Auriscalpium vulgare]|uniref:Uncharacterized protein n=1 Tax=Auriscalpium vulgare TaxID=40419 RepID=A0ACB8RZS2_9AGAM|nr:hypothetical protein FA95DRAFT_1488803 [Auriscalpium vulgare]